MAKVKKKQTTGSGKSKTALFKYMGLDGVEYSMTLKEKKFVELYMQGGANGTQAVIDAGYDVYNKKTGAINRNLAAVIAYELLRKPHIYSFVNVLMDQYGFNDGNVERQHMFLLNQDADLTAKRGAVDMFYKLKGKYAPEKIAMTPLEKMSDQELQAAAGVTVAHDKK